MKIKILLLCFLCSVISLFLIYNQKSIADDSCSSSGQVSTLAGNITITYDWRSDCECNGGEPIIYLSNDVVARNNFVEVWVDSEGDACPTYNWVINGNGFHFNNDSGPATATTEADSAKLELWADNAACGSVIISVTDACGESNTSSVREADNGQWVLIEELSGGTLDNLPGNGTCYSNYECIEGAFKYLDSWVAGTNMNIRWHPTGELTKYPCTPYDSNYCYDPGFYPKFYHVGIHYQKKWRWDCP